MSFLYGFYIFKHFFRHLAEFRSDDWLNFVPLLGICQITVVLNLQFLFNKSKDGGYMQTSIVFTGDIGFDRYMNKKWEDDNLLSNEILDFLNNSKHVVANVEGALYNGSDDNNRGIFFHAMDINAASFLKKIKADIWSIGNNHIMDAGKQGLLSTIDIAKSMNASTIGAGINEEEASRPLYLKEAGGIGLICVAYQTECVPATKENAGVFRWNDMELISKKIKEIKSKCRWCIVVSHGGEEFASLPNPYTRNRYLKFLEMGADIVVGHHPHVVENYELFDNKAIFYSLGNFIFDTDYQRVHLYTNRGVLLKLNFDENSFSFDALGTYINRNSERIEKNNLPDIFTNINNDEYNLLIPLSAKAFIEEEKRKMVYLEPNIYKGCDDSAWNEYFFSEKPDGYCKDEHMDLSLIYPLSLKYDENNWKNSSLTKVKEYICAQLK